MFGQKRGVFGVVKRELRRRSTIEPIIGHLKEGHLGRRYLKGRARDAASNPLRLRLQLPPDPRLAEALWCLFLIALLETISSQPELKSVS